MTRRPPFVGFLGAIAFFAMSNTPSLIPRHWEVQGLVGGIAAALGYGLGTLISHLWRALPPPEPSHRVKKASWWVLTLAGPVAVAAMTLYGGRWQRELHELMGLPVPSPWAYLGGTLFAMVVAGLLVAIGRGLRVAARSISSRLSRWLHPRIAKVIGGVVVTILVIGILDGIVVDSLFSAADESFRIADEVIEEDVSPPGSPMRSGSAESIVTFEELGKQGRAFVAGGPSAGPAAGTGGLGTEPIRVYAGLESAPDAVSRARIVVEELERTGAFERSVLCVMTTTGTGWINPQAAAALEYLWDGDTALAASQYSYLPSWVSFLVDSGRGREAGSELFNAIRDRWSLLPEDARPLLLVFGESLGADGADAAFSGIADIRNRTDGVLFVGPPNFSNLWRSFTERRDPGTPEALPVYDGGGTVRFASKPADLERPDAPWYKPRVVYLQHTSDPIVWWSPRMILRRPDWLEEPRGEDVLPSVRWFPLVTFWQLSADLGTASRVPTGHGHDYGDMVVDAWAAIAAPEGWTPDDTERLRARLAASTG